MKIGIIGPTPSVERIRSVIRMEDAYMEYVEYPCNLHKVAELLERVQPELDGILFTGARYLNYASRHVSASIPWTSPRRTSDSPLLAALFRAHLAGCDITRITFDLHNTTTDQLLEILCGQLGLDADRIALYRYNDTQRYQDYLNSDALAGRYADGACEFHIGNFRDGRAAVCLTDSPSAAAVLVKKGYPVFLSTFTKDSVIAALNDLRVRTQLYARQRTEEHQEAVLCLTVKMPEEYSHGNQEFRQIQSAGRIETAVFVFAQSVGGAVEKRSVTQYLVFTTKGELDAATDDLQDLSFMDRLLAVVDVEQVSMGIGFGVTHRIAKANAQQANKSARQQPYSCYYTKAGEEVARGPFILRPPQTAKEYSRQLLERVSRETNVGLTALDALAKAQRQYGFQEITPGELAKMTGMSLNNIHRILVRLEAGGYAAVVGRQSHAGTGRPRRLFRLNLGFVPPDDAK